MSSLSPPRHRNRTQPPRMSPIRQQQLLVRRLSSSRHQREGTANREPPHTAVGKKSGSHSASKKRPFPSTVRSSPNIEPADTIDEYETWEEVSSIVPLLTYGEESDELLSSLLKLPNCDSVDVPVDPVGGSACKKCGGNILTDEQIQEMRDNTLGNLTRALENMLQIRDVMRRRAIAEAALQNRSKANKSTPPPVKKQRHHLTPQNASTDILPWNVLLRVIVRMASHVAGQLSSKTNLRCNCQTANESTKETSSIKNAESVADEKEQNEAKSESTSTMHPMLQALDIVSAGLQVLLRIQRQQHESLSKTRSGHTTPTKPASLQGASPIRSSLQSSIKRRITRLPRDRMLRDWKSKNECHLTNDVGREIWGPSRHAFLKDMESISKLWEEGDIGISAEEWHEKVDSIVESLDECTRLDAATGRETHPHETAGVGQQQQQKQILGISPSLLRYGARSPSKSPSLASITRAHVERVGRSSKKSERKPGNDGSHVSSKEVKPADSSGSICLNLQSMMEEESNQHLSIEDETDELEDAYRLAIAFVSSNGEGEGESARETIERRLNLLVHQVKGTASHDVKKRVSLNIDGARSYLESLLRMLVQPPDPSVWLRLMSNSNGKETPIMLRRGRTLLVSFLISIKSPGWKEAEGSLESSPVPSYLGYLSHGENNQSSIAGGKEQQHEMNKRTTYFLPAIDMGVTAIPPSPIVTEVGLSLCVKNFLHKDTPEKCVSACRPPSGTSSGVSLFRNFGPLQYTSSSSNGHEHLLSSIASPLPDANELTRDLFDLTLRFAADDDGEHKQKPFPLRLTTPSALESLNVILQVVSDHLEWISPLSISSRYRFILQYIIQTFGKNDLLGEIICSEMESDDKGFTTWMQRSAHLIQCTKMNNRGRMALYTTQVMMMLYSRNIHNVHKPISKTKQTHFFACLQLRQSSQFWKEVDATAIDFPSSIVPRVLSQNFCVRLLLPLSFKCTLLLANSSYPQGPNANQSQDSQSALSLVTILCSVLDVIANNGFLRDCIHVGWAIQMLTFSISYFVFGNDCNWRDDDVSTLSECDTSCNDTMWKYIARQLNSLYHNVWGREWQSPGFQSRSEECISYESTGNACIDERMVVLMPSFEIYAGSLIKYVCNVQLSAESSGVRNFSRFIANVAFDRYAQALQLCPNPKKEDHNVDHPHQDEFSLISGWIHLLASTLQELIYHQKGNNWKNRNEKTEEDLAEKILVGLITPMMRSLHLHIMQRVIYPDFPDGQKMNECSNCTRSSECAASVFVHLYVQGKEQFLKKPSHVKTKRWGVYRICLERIFLMTPPGALFAFNGNSNSLTDHSSDVLHDIWDQFGQCNLSHSILIMVAAGLHVNSSASCLSADSPLKDQDGLALQLKQLYTEFSARAKRCIMDTFGCFSETKPPQEKSLAHVNDLIRFVRRELSLHRGAGIGLAWWNDVSVDLLSRMKKSSIQPLECKDKKGLVSSRDIARAFSTLQDNLSAISSVSSAK